MKAPDKIYVGIRDLGYGYATDVSTTPKEGLSEYIRKDALLELIKEESKFWDDGEMIFRGLIDKLNSM
jgi:hypothetical protein